MNNTEIIKSQGRSDSLFLPTGDSKIILKTLKQEEFQMIFDKFIYFYLNYLECSPNSLICRIYGIFSVKPSESSEPLLIILMRDARGPFKNVKLSKINCLVYRKNL